MQNVKFWVDCSLLIGSGMQGKRQGRRITPLPQQGINKFIEILLCPVLGSC